jgi:hypothetical protein
LNKFSIVKSDKFTSSKIISRFFDVNITNIFDSEIFNKNLYLIAKEGGLEEAMN